MRKSKTEEKTAKYLRIYRELEPFIDSVSQGFSMNLRALTAEDLKQECAIRIYELIDMEHPYFTENDERTVILILKRVIVNRLKDVLRSHKRLPAVVFSSNGESRGYEDAFDIEDPESMFDRIFEHQVVNLLRESFKHGLEGQVLDLIHTPDDELMIIVLSNHKLSSRPGKTDVRILKADLAERLRVSPATVSRVFARMRRKLRDILNDRSSPP